MTKRFNIYFFNEGVNYSLKNKKFRRYWIIHCIFQENKIPGQINIIFCTDSYIVCLNKKFLNHKYFTDIITFNNALDEKYIDGDMYISLQRVKENAKKYREKLGDEVDRVIIHGVLHLAGYSDKELKNKNIMKEKEDFYLSERYKSFT